MTLSKISAHVGKYEKMAIPDKEVREALVALIERFAGAEVSIEEIKIIRGTARIQVSPVIKNQILLNKKKILEGLKMITGKTLEEII